MELPLEIMEMVGEACDDKTWGRLRRTCHVINEITEHQQYKRWQEHMQRRHEAGVARHNERVLAEIEYWRRQRSEDRWSYWPFVVGYALFVLFIPDVWLELKW